MARAWTAAFDHPDVPERGAAVVHLQRGLALLDGLQTLAMGTGSRREMVRLAFAGDNAVLVPPADLALIWPYRGRARQAGAGQGGRKHMVGAADRGRSGNSGRRQGAREAHQPTPPPPRAETGRTPGPLYERFVARFPYFPTVDQAKAIQDVLDDLAAGHPMDRVVCGDVGFGKTEVALRAAAAVALSGKQVAIAVPTTVLARQHVETFRKRFGPLGIEVGSLSRATSGPETREIKEGLRKRQAESRCRHAGARLQRM